MIPRQGMNAHQQQSVEFLARKMHVSIEDVADLYGSEFARLESEARIKGFLPILAIRNVRDVLRRRKAKEQGPF